MTSIKLFTKNKLNIALAIGFVLTIISSQVATFASDVGKIRENTLRLHIIANSDSKSDQKLKLDIRDLLLAENLFVGGKTKGDAIDTLEDKLVRIEQIASDEINRQGYDYDVKAEIVNMYFDKKAYEEYTLPAGNYDALRVTIGDAVGKNWWCVLYPSLCVPVAVKQKELELSNLSKEQLDIIMHSEDYEVRFAAVEWYNKLMSLFSGKR